MTGLTFTITNPYTDTPAPFTITPKSYKITSPFLDHQRLEFTQFKKTPRILKRAKIEVTGQDANVPNFLGWVVQRNPQPNPVSNEPQKYLCYGFSKDLEWRFPFLKTYTAGQYLFQILADNPESQGLIFRANSLAPDAWNVFDAGLHIYSLDYAGLVNAARFVSPDVWLSNGIGINEQCTHGTDYDPYSLGVKEWCQDDTELYLRTPGADPATYPCYVVDCKNAFLKRATSVNLAVLLNENVNQSQESEYSLLKRIVRSVGQEYEFVNGSDGHQYLNWNIECARGNKYDPSAVDAFTFEEQGCGYGYNVIYDWAWADADPETHGFDLIALRGHSTVAINVALDNAFVYQRHWKEKVRRDMSMGDLQVVTEGEYLKNHYMREEVLNIWAPENHSILPGDWTWVYLCSSPYDGEYLGRVVEKVLEDDVMKLSIGLFEGQNWW